MWTEHISAPLLTYSNYISGAAAFLQSLHHGYGGFRLYSDHIDINPLVPSGVTDLSFVGIDYLGSSFDIYCDQEGRITVILTSQAMHGIKLKLMVYKTEQIYTLEKSVPLVFERNKAAIYSANVDLPNKIQR